MADPIVSGCNGSSCTQQCQNACKVNLGNLAGCSGCTSSCAQNSANDATSTGTTSCTNGLQADHFSE
jgi:hypothetical protein